MNKLLFMGRKSYGAEALQWCIENGWDVVAVVTDDHQDTSPTANTARKYGLNLLDYEAFDKQIDSNSLEFDLAVSYVYWKILKKPLIQIPKLGILNFHPAPLPELRGAGGFNLAILENHETFGVTVHYMDEGIDTGPIVEVDRFSIDAKSETAQSLEKKSHKRMVELFKKTLTRVKKEGILPSKKMSGGRHLSRKEMEERTCKASPLPSAPSPLANGASAFASLPSSTALPPPLCARRRCERSRWCDSRSYCCASRSTARVAAATYGRRARARTSGE